MLLRIGKCHASFHASFWGFFKGKVKVSCTSLNGLPEDGLVLEMLPIYDKGKININGNSSGMSRQGKKLTKYL